MLEIGIFSLGYAEAEDLDRHVVNDRVKGLVTLARRAEQAGFDTFALGEYHHPPFVLSSPAVVLGAIAAVTTTLRLTTSVSLITVNDPVKLAEDFSTVQHLSDGRLSIMFGRGISTDIYRWWGLAGEDTVAIAAEKNELFRRLWTERKLHWSGKYRAPLEDFTLTPQPLTAELPEIWQTSIRTKELVEQTARDADGFFANYVHFSAAQAAPHVHYFRERFEAHGHGAAGDAPVGSGAAVYVRRNSQDALREYRDRGIDLSTWPTKYDSLEHAVRESALTVGSPAQVLDKIATFQEAYGGYRRQLFSIDGRGGDIDRSIEQIELIGEHVVPELRKAYS
ncbi:LLM class flavin-dependent oxidoreductase [Nakamurella leprariae]|uniref:LLM class flavin-dependent oxidoreductase n=1 Tax=Nakamurella leprariae TaxID=2803911 RepID=A0A938YJU0_9ACTN|nr:LLM class flavin-dependent oxidoreductase [Nakamurella leprariae]MBM9469597.1 LLM class flavin-dependent oxidoreductase [Nakamurella leprariae]